MRAVTVLGSGNAYCEDGRGHASFLAEGSHGGRILVDAGATTLLRLREHVADFEDVDTVLVTHFHGDHVLGLAPLLLDRKTFGARRRPPTVAGPRGVGDVVRTICGTVFPGIEHDFPVRFVDIDPGETVELDGLSVAASRMTHRPESLGYRLTGPSGGTVAFSGDCRFDDRLVRLVAGADLAIVEVGLPGAPSPEVHHVALEEMLVRRAELDCRRLVFTHLNDRIHGALEAAGLGIPAFDGLRIALDRPH